MVGCWHLQNNFNLYLSCIMNSPHEFCTDRTEHRLSEEPGNKSVSPYDVTFLFSHGTPLAS